MGKKKKDEWVDDGRIIANMESVQDINSAPLGRPRQRRRGSFDPFGQVVQKKEPIELTKKERRSIVGGVFVAHGILLLVLLLLAVILVYIMPA